MRVNRWQYWLNYVTPSLLGMNKYPIGPLIARTQSWHWENGSHHTTLENPERKNTLVNVSRTILAHRPLIRILLSAPLPPLLLTEIFSILY